MDQPLPTFTFEGHPATMTDDELEEIADLILDEWSAKLDAPPTD